VASYSLVDGGGGARHREVEAAWKGNTGGSRGGESVGHVCSLHELEWREEKEERGGSLNKEVCERPCPQKKKGGGGSGMGRGPESRADRVQRKGGKAQYASEQGECGIMPWPNES